MSEKIAVIQYEVDCPHPDCNSKLCVADGLPAGVYDCRCKKHRLRLDWSQYNAQFRVPVVTMAEERKIVDHAE